MIKRLTPEHEWAASLVADIPRPWAARLLSAWEKRRGSFNPLVTTAEGTARRKANEQLRESAAMLRPVSDELPLDASDSALCDVAWSMAERCRVTLLAIEAEQQRVPTTEFLCAVRAAGVDCDAGELDLFAQRTQLAALCAVGGIEPPEASRYEDQPAVRRMVAAHWWKGRLRKAHGKARETAAIQLGLVRRDRECYASSVSVLDRQWQNERNAAALAATIAKNLETEQEFTLAELAAKGPANAYIKRCELMTRINGFERIAIAAGHAGLFLTITCPSKMHRMKTLGDRTVENGKWDRVTTPDLAQKYLAKVWARIRAALARGKRKEGRPPVSLYGFRIAEPQHDGTPHWHCLFFYPQAHDAHVRAVVRKYALAMDGDEPGAQEKRCDFKTMDPAKGTAAGYIAKYVAKNIDGYRLEKDLEGNDSLETSARVEAWATRWRIRQFQQIGGPPVTVWRELRRVEAVPGDAPAFVVKAHNAVNKVAVFEGRADASVAWDHYVQAQGGVTCGRDYRVRIAKVSSDKVGRYGETGAPQIVGVEYFEVAKVRDAIGNWIDVLPRTVTVESRRFTWEIARTAQRNVRTALRSMASPLVSGITGAPAAGGYGARAGVEGLDFGFERAQRAPWTCVNNCTGGEGDQGNGGRWERASGGSSGNQFRVGAGNDAVQGTGSGKTNQGRTAHTSADDQTRGKARDRGNNAAARSGRSTLTQ